jgi:outer membrane protein OmpA-like peptidoglycan-associated protein/opacity protein-like surface antigen
MKKIILLSLLSSLAIGGLLAQKNTTETKSSEWSKWSIYLDGGIDIAKASEGDLFKRKYYDPEIGVGIERTFNSLFGLGVDYMYMRQTNDVYKSRINQINFLVPINMSNLLSPCRSWQKLNFFFTPGVGVGLGSYDSYTYDGIDYPSSDLEKSFSLLVGIGAEYDISSHFAIGLNTQYRWNSNMAHTPQLPNIGNKYGDYGYYGVNLSVRYKFAGKENVRNNNQLLGKCYTMDYGARLDEMKVMLDKYAKELEDVKKREADSITSLKKSINDLKECCAKTPVVAPVVVKEEKPVEEKPAPAPVKITLRSIYYKLNTWELLPSSYPELDKVVVFMQKNPNYKVEVGSHTDSRGSDQSNLKLSEKRAQSVVDYLESKGISRDRMIVKGYGETQILNRCKNGVVCSEAEHAVNRRTEFTILNASSDVVLNSDLLDNPGNYDEVSLEVTEKPTASVYIIIGAFVKKESVMSAVKELAEIGENAEVLPHNAMFRVGIPCSSEQQAEQKIKQLKMKFKDAWILND